MGQVFLRWVEDFLSSLDPGQMVRSALVCSGGDFRKPTQVRARADKCRLGEVRGTSPRPSCQRNKAVETFVKEETAPHGLVQTGCLSSGAAAPRVLPQDTGLCPAAVSPRKLGFKAGFTQLQASPRPRPSRKELQGLLAGGRWEATGVWMSGIHRWAVETKAP